MPADWSRLGSVAPEALVNARNLAHHAAQWATKAARANLTAASDDSHSSLDWDAGLATLLSQPLATKQGGIRVGLGVADLRLMILRGSAVGATFALNGRTNAEAGAWVDAALLASVLPEPPVPGRWHTQGIVAAVATGGDTLKLEDRRRELLAFIIKAVEISRAQLGA